MKIPKHDKKKGWDKDPSLLSVLVVEQDCSGWVGSTTLISSPLLQPYSNCAEMGQTNRF